MREWMRDLPVYAWGIDRLNAQHKADILFIAHFLPTKKK